MSTHIKLIILSMLLIMFSHQAAAPGIAVSPATITLENALKGNSSEQIFMLFNLAPDEARYSLNTSGDIEGWVSFYDLKNNSEINSTIDIGPKDNSTIKAVFHIPQDAANGNYTGQILAMTVPKETTSTGSSSIMRIGASIQVNITVTGDQIVKANVTAIIVEDTEPGLPLKAKAFVRNNGNVIIKPDLNVTVFYNNTTLIHKFGNKSDQIKPQEINMVLAEWQTTAANLPSNYTAKVNVSLDGNLIASEDKNFTILPVGTLSRNGTLMNITFEGQQKVNVPVKVKANFKNTGIVDTTAKFKAEVYKDGTLVDTIESDESLVGSNQETELVSYLKPDASGKYTLKGKVAYSGKETNVTEVSTNIGGILPGFESSLTVSILAVLYCLRRKKSI